MAPVISDIYIYPIKSCKALKVTEADISKYGLAYDRVWQVIDPETSAVRTMRQLPPMTLVDQQIVGDELVVSVPGKTIRLPLYPKPENYEERDAFVFKVPVKALDMGEEAATFFTDYLGVPCRLVFKSPNHVRTVVEHTPNKDQLGFQAETGFADNFPILCLSHESVEWINQSLDNPVSVLNFRPNIVLRGVSEPFEEDMWCKVKIEGTVYYFTCRCTRCDLPNVDPATGIKDKLQPQKTLQTIRRVDKGKVAKFFACVGINVQPSVTEGAKIRVGDEIDVVQVWEGERKKTGLEGWVGSESEQVEQAERLTAQTTEA
ncbi:hypothetical protein BGW38_010671 [Lunasporangiospora selenospora]|uniref:MOSC domain-containing protein n=1 Tax=Lunasporangiospora selenospora TaxID=979761 RepID=A0A9P6G5N1_9FUNG|nr:hypothetical protein BGW38_010671 [Lunasporangiospora selenospora]